MATNSEPSLRTLSNDDEPMMNNNGDHGHPHRVEEEEDVVETVHSGNHNDNHHHDPYGDDIALITTSDVRVGTISSARLNILSTMVGGGCLSLPLAFQQTGNAFMGPLLLLMTGIITDFCFRLLVASAVHLHPPHTIRPGKDTFESITSAAFGPKAYIFSMGLVVLMCFFGTVGYSVLLRDMLEPINDVIITPSHPFSSSWWLQKNFSMFVVILLVTPFCTLRHLTALKDCGAASMTAVLILGSCIVYRSVECNLMMKPTTTTGGGENNDNNNDNEPWYHYLTLFPNSWLELLDAIPLFISCFVCHYNILPVHNELKDPTPARVSWWLRSTLLFSGTIYLIIGVAGSAYAKCTPDHKVHGNILLDFDEDDPLLMIGRMCLAITITLAFPMLIIPARDIILRSLILPAMRKSSRTSNTNHEEVTDAVSSSSTPTTTPTTINETREEELREPLLLSEQDTEQQQPPEVVEEEDQRGDDPGNRSGQQDISISIANAPLSVLLGTSMVLFWSAGALASAVTSIDMVWDLLGSSLSIILSYLIPAGTYLVLTKMPSDRERLSSQPYTRRQHWSRILCWYLLWMFFPLMIISTTNAFINTFCFGE